MNKNSKNVDPKTDAQTAPPRSAVDGTGDETPNDLFEVPVGDMISDDTFAAAKPMDYGEMNEQDARESGYIEDDADKEANTPGPNDTIH